MVLGMIILKKQYSLEKYISVSIITVGIIICTIFTANSKEVKGLKIFVCHKNNFLFLGMHWL